MKCTWCDSEPISGGKAPVGTVGVKYLLACQTHDKLIDTLGYERRDVSEIRMALRREEKEAKRS